MESISWLQDTHSNRCKKHFSDAYQIEPDTVFIKEKLRNFEATMKQKASNIEGQIKNAGEHKQILITRRGVKTEISKMVSSIEDVKFAMHRCGPDIGCDLINKKSRNKNEIDKEITTIQHEVKKLASNKAVILHFGDFSDLFNTINGLQVPEISSALDTHKFLQEMREICNEIDHAYGSGISTEEDITTNFTEMSILDFTRITTECKDKLDEFINKISKEKYDTSTDYKVFAKSNSRKKTEALRNELYSVMNFCNSLFDFS